MIIAVELISRIAQQHFLPLIRKPQSILDRIMKQKSTLKPQIRCIRHFPKKKIYYPQQCFVIYKIYW